MAIGRITGQMLSSTLNRDTTDLKIASTGESNLFVVDATNDRIGIGVASPTVQFQTSGSATIGTDLTVTGNLTVNGSTTTINTTNLIVDDKNIELAHSLSGNSPTDAAADGGGIILKGDTDHTILWNNTTDDWDFSENIDIASGKVYKINGSTVLDANNLNLENISINGNVISSSSNADINITPSGTGKVVLEGINIQGTVITGNDSTVISFGGNQLSGVADPTGATDVATKNYVDNNAGGTLNLGDSSSNAGAVDLTNDIALEFRSGDSITATVAGNGVTFDLNETISVDQINAGDSSVITVGSATRFNSSLSFNGDGAVNVTSIKDEDDMSSDSATALATQQSIKAYVDSQITATNTLTLGDDASSEISLNLDDVLNVKGGNSITSTVTGDSLTFALDDRITVDEIAAKDSSAVSIQSALQLDSTLQVAGASTMVGNVTMNGSLTVNTIDSADSTAVTINDGLQVNGNFGFNEGVVVSTILDEDAFGSNSATALATQQSIKAYVDSVAGGTITLGDSASNAGSVDINGNQDLEFRSGDSITATVAGNGVTFDLNETITVDQINAGDSTVVTFGAGIEASTISATNVSLNQIGARDSSAVSITSALQTTTIQSSGAITAGGNITATGSFIIGNADMNETDLEKLDGITDGTGAANKALVLDGSSDITSGVNTFTATTGDFQTVKANIISSDDSTSVTLNDGLIVVGNFSFDGGSSVSTILDEDNMASNSDTALATQQSIKAYVDSVAGGTLTLGDSSSNAGSIDINGNEALEFRSGDSITTTVAGNGVTFDLNETISVDQINAGDSSTITLGAAVEGSTMNMNTINVDQINARDSSAVTLGNTLIVSEIYSGDSSFVRIRDSFETEAAQINQSLTVDGNAQIMGNLTVQGTTTYINTTNTKVADPLLLLNNGNSGGSDIDAGIMVERGSAGNNAVFYWNEGDDRWKAVTSTSEENATAVTDSAYATINQGGLVFGAESVVVTSIKDEDNMASDSDTALATQQSIKAYVDSVAGGSIKLGDDASNSGAVDINGNEELMFHNGDSITPVVSANGVTFNLNETITVDQINAGDSSLITIGTATKFNSSLAFNGDGAVNVTSIKDEDDMTSNSATALATQQSIKAYVDTEIAGLSQTVKISDDASTVLTLDLKNDTLSLAGGNSITSSISGDTVTLNLDDRITVDEIAAKDSSAVSIVSPLQTETIQSSGAITAGGNITATGSFIIGNADMNETDLEKLDGITDGTVTANKALVVDANRDLSTIRNLTSDGTVTATTGDFQTVKANVISSDDSTAVNIQDALNVDGNVDVGGNFTISNGTSISAILDEDNMASNSDTALATQQSIKAYVDSVAGGSLAIGDSASNAGSVNLPANEQLIFNGNDSITATVSGNTVTFDLNETITVDQINAGDSSTITFGAAIEGTIAEFNSIFVDAIDTRDSTSLSFNSGFEVDGDIHTTQIHTDTIGARDSSSVRFESAVEFTGEVRAGGLLIENSRITPVDSSFVDFDGNILSGVATPTEDNHAANKGYVDDNIVTEINQLTDVDAPAADVQAGDLLAGASDDSTGGNFTLTSQMNSGILIPSGTTAQRPGIYAGIIRYNSETGKYEGSTDLSTWNAFAMEGTAETINKDVFTGDGSTATFTFSNVTDATAGSGNNGANGLIVYIDNVLQEPTQNYTITNTTITLDSAPHASARIVVLQGFDGGAGGGTAGGLTTVTNTDVDSAVEALDSWAVATYRAAKYTYRIENANGEHQAGEILVVHNGTSAFFTEYAKVLTGNNDLITFTVGVGSGNVNLFGSANTPNSNFRAKRINLEVA